MSEYATTGLDGVGTEAATVARIAQDAAIPSEVAPGELYSSVLRDGAHFEILDLEKHLDAPRRPRGTYRPATVDAFIAHVERHWDDAHSTIWVHPTSGQVVAVFNDTTAENAETGWRDHRSQLDLQHTPEWLFWRTMDGHLKSQLAFAEHVEEGLKEIVEPAAADMLELAQSFHATQKGSFRSANRLHDGTVQVQYDEELDAKAGRSKEIPVPTEFTLAIAPFLGEEPYKITARLRYRLNAGVLQLGYKLERPDDVVRDALDHVAAKLTEKFEHVFVGVAAA